MFRSRLYPLNPIKDANLGLSKNLKIAVKEIFRDLWQCKPYFDLCALLWTPLSYPHITRREA